MNRRQDEAVDEIKGVGIGVPGAVTRRLEQSTNVAILAGVYLICCTRTF